MMLANKNESISTFDIKSIVSLVIIFTFLTGCSSTREVRDESMDYDSKRRALIAHDATTRFSSDILLNDEEKKLQTKLLTLRLQMKSHYDSLGFFPPAQPFFKYKSHVETTKLFKLLRKMPKGGIHHLHPSAAADFAWLVETVTEHPNAYVYWGEPSDNFVKGEIRFFVPKNIPTGFKAAAELQNRNNNFKKELFELLTISKEAEMDSLDIWIKFEKVFQRTRGAYSYKPLFESYIQNAIETLIDDGVMHIESRSLLNSKYEFDTIGNTINYPRDTTVQILKRVEKRIQQKHPEFSHKVIYTSLRFFPVEKVAEEFVTAFRYRKKYPELVKGFDLVAEEDNGNTTYHFKSCWAMRDSLQQVYGVDMPLCLHDGESNSQSVQNMYDALLLNSKRIGHGFNIMNFPKAIELAKEKDVCIEVNPLSNQILGYVKDLRLHPASLMLRHGIQCSISSDDPAIFDYQGLSYDYWYATMAWELSLKDIKKLVFNSITYSTLNSKEKKHALHYLNKKWAEFVAYGNDFL